MSDLIDRQVAIDAVCANGDYYDIIAALERLTADTVAILENVPPAQPTVLNAKKLCEFWDSESNICALHRPSAQPEQKTGKWIYHESVDVFECSVCGRQMVRNIFDYCPWCGARMEDE